MAVVRLHGAGVDLVGSVGVDGAAVVAGEHDQGVVCQLQAVQRRQHLPDGPIERVNGIAPHPALAGAAEPRMRHARHVDVVGAEVEKERLVPVLFEKGDGLLRQSIGDFLVLPEGGLAAALLADARDAQDKGPGAPRCTE